MKGLSVVITGGEGHRSGGQSRGAEESCCVCGCIAACGGSPASAPLLCGVGAGAGGWMPYSGGTEEEQATKV